MALGIGSGLLGLISILCTIWVIYDVWAINRRLETVWKVIWTILAIFFNIITAIVYYIMHKR